MRKRRTTSSTSNEYTTQTIRLEIRHQTSPTLIATLNWSSPDKETHDEDCDCGHKPRRWEEEHDITTSDYDDVYDRGKSPAELKIKYPLRKVGLSPRVSIPSMERCI
jgi:hypothetical protein